MMFDDLITIYLAKYPEGLDFLTISPESLNRPAVLGALQTAIDRGKPLTDDEWWALFGGPPPPGALL